MQEENNGTSLSDEENNDNSWKLTGLGKITIDAVKIQQSPM